jgi:hypothetical protein
MNKKFWGGAHEPRDPQGRIEAVELSNCVVRGEGSKLTPYTFSHKCFFLCRMHKEALLNWIADSWVNEQFVSCEGSCSDKHNSHIQHIVPNKLLITALCLMLIIFFCLFVCFPLWWGEIRLLWCGIGVALLYQARNTTQYTKHTYTQHTSFITHIVIDVYWIFFSACFPLWWGEIS